MRKLLPRSLRARLILSFGALIFLTLLLAGLGTVLLLKAEQERSARQRVGLLTEAISRRAIILEANGLKPQQIEETLQAEYDVRILVVDNEATVVGDTGETLRGTRISQLERQGLPARPLSDLRYRVQSYRQENKALLLFTTPQGVVATLASAPGAGVFVPQYQVVVAVDEGAVTKAWRDLLPRFFMAGGIAFAGSVFAAGILARSITRPIRQITLASEAMARGNYDQQIPAYGGDEVGRLSRAFNEMARQVGLSNRTLRDFLANVSHELKTPLTSIQGFSQAMVDGALQRPQDYAEAGKIINEEAVRMRGLVDDLLYLSQVEAGDVNLHYERIQPNDLLLATQERFARRAGQASVRLAVETTGTPEIEADPRRIEQAVANIVDNAVRHTPAGGRVTLRSGADNGHVRFAVHNTGSLIPPEALPRLFDRFFQVDPARAKAEGNTGLGLAITKEIVEAHSGHIDVTSAEGRGTEFVITLPVERRPAQREVDGHTSG
jgi:two-component system, OmpR family, sensor kinase